MENKKSTARLAGLFYLLMGITGVFSMIYVPLTLFVPNDGAATSQNIMDSRSLFIGGIFSNIISQIIFILLVFTLFKLLREVNRMQSLIMVGLVLVGVSITIFNMLNEYAMLISITNVSLQEAFESSQLQAFTLFFYDMYKHGIHLSEIFWGLWLLPLGLLIIHSQFIPKPIGVLLIIASVGYVLSSVCHFFIPELSDMISPLVSTLSTIGEFSLIGWLLIKGVRTLPRESVTLVT